jgi:hypothetical protein
MAWLNSAGNHLGPAASWMSEYGNNPNSTLPSSTDLPYRRSLAERMRTLGSGGHVRPPVAESNGCARAHGCTGYAKDTRSARRRVLKHLRAAVTTAAPSASATAPPVKADPNSDAAAAYAVDLLLGRWTLLLGGATRDQPPHHRGVSSGRPPGRRGRCARGCSDGRRSS